MEAILWLLILLYVFGVGYHLTGKINSFVRHHPRAFRGSRKILKILPEGPKQHLEDDMAEISCYNGATNSEERECHEVSHP